MLTPMNELRLWHADDALLVVEKPAGLPAVPGRTPELQDCVAARAQARWPDALVVHRLDMATSGLMLMARNLDVQRRLGRAFERREIVKRYVAVVHGVPAAPAGRIALRIGADWADRPRRRVDELQGREASTDWRLIEVDGVHARLELTPHTGRTHQLRVHLAAIGHPIVGDTLYAAGVEDTRHAPRMLLHATDLEFTHPLHGSAMALHSPAAF